MSAGVLAKPLVSRRPSIAIMGVSFDNVSTADALGEIERMIASAQPHYLVTANVDFLVQAREDVELRRILLDAHLVLCDGTPLVWASRMLGNPLPERVAGSDLVPRLIQVAAEKHYRLFLLGASPEAASRAAERLVAQWPGLNLAGHYSPPFKQLLEMDHEDIRQQVAKAKPDLLLVSFGCPKQEKWIAMHYRKLGVPVTIGVGATIDFLAGQVRRAPVWMQRTGAEWLFRLAQEPRRLFGRYFKDLRVFGAGLFLQWLRTRSQGREHRPAAQILPLRLHSGSRLVCIPERLDFETVCQFTPMLDQLLDGSSDIVLEMSDVRFVDSTGVGLLMRLQKRLRGAGRHMALLGLGGEGLRVLALMRLNDFFITAPDMLSGEEAIRRRAEEERRRQEPISDGLLRWPGEVTAVNAEEVWAQTAAHLTSAAATKPWAIDLSAVRFIDSSGLGLMIRARKLAREHGTVLVFKSPPKTVLNVIRLAGLEKHLTDTAQASAA